jgi:predicted aspartyl protease
MLRTALIGAAGLVLLAQPAAAAPACTLKLLAELPVRTEGFKPIVTATVNGQPGDFFVDSGSAETILSTTAAERFGVSSVAAPLKFRVAGIGGEAREVRFGKIKDLSFAATPLHNLPIMVVGRDYGHGVSGNIGLTLLAFSDVEFDLGHNMIRMYRPEGCGPVAVPAYWADPKHLNWLDFKPLDKDRQHIVGEAQVNGQTLKVMFDTGAGHSSLSRSAAERLGFRPDAPAVRPGGMVHGFGPGERQSWIAPFDSFAMGGEEVHNTHLRVIDGAAARDHDMLIGADFFLAHRVYVSMAQNRIYFTYNGGPVFRLEAVAPGAEAPAEPPAPTAQ